MRPIVEEPSGQTTNTPFNEPEKWFLTAEERGNTATILDSRHANGVAWTTGNQARALIDGQSYFHELLIAVQAMGPGDLLMFTDWRGDPDERLDGPGTEVAEVFAAAARRGVDVRGLLWRSHSDHAQFSASENRRFDEIVDEAGGQCLLDMRVRPLGSHHQKLVVLRHADHPERDVAFIGGIDLCHGRRDNHQHFGDPQTIEMAAIYGSQPPWHDIQLAVQGPAVGDAETVFRERWNDPTPISTNPIHLIQDKMRGEVRTARPLPAQLPDPEPRGDHAAQLLRTYPRRIFGYPFAPKGEMSVARGYHKALLQARSLVYVEDQYLWSGDVARVYADALKRQPKLRLIVIIPGYPDRDGSALPPNYVGRDAAMHILRKAGGSRVAIYSLENAAGTPIYVHAKTCIIDDTWGCVGSDNANRRSWTHDSELSCAVLHIGSDKSNSWAREMRLELAHEHLGTDASMADLADPIQTFEVFHTTATALDTWYTEGKQGPRPTGQLRTYNLVKLKWWTHLWATPIYRLLYDPDARSIRKRLMHRF